MAVYLVDGYNLLHEMLGRQRPADLEDERTRLVDRIVSYMGESADRAVIVFDSHASTLQTQNSATRNVEVVFGSFFRTADAVIEREAYNLSQDGAVVVVTSDKQLQQTAFRTGVIRRSSRQFAADLQEHTKRIAFSPDCITMSHRIEDRLDRGLVDRLKTLRDRLSGQEQEEE
jgi:predicted RNA-binding protein with PIN domain